MRGVTLWRAPQTSLQSGRTDRLLPMEETGRRHGVVSGDLMGMEEQLLRIEQVPLVFPHSEVHWDLCA